VALLLAATLLSGCGYGRIRELDEAAVNARLDIEVQLRRRAELVPNLLSLVQSYGAVSEEMIAAVADARASLVSAVRASDMGSMENWSARLSEALGELLAAVTRYPQMEGDRGYQLLRSQLEQTEIEIEEAGRSYNEAAARFNEYIAEFPQLVMAKVIGAGPKQSFKPRDPPAPGTNADQ
jgi:LemA protein